MILVNTAFYTAFVVASSCPPAAATATSLNSPTAFLPDRRDSNNTNPSLLAIRQNEMEVGSPCNGLEGEWNCMNTTFQRCASGQWSAVLNTAYGTVCEPEGFSYDFQPAFASWFPSGDTTQTIVFTETATARATHSPTYVIVSQSSDAQGTASGSVIWAIFLGLMSTTLLFVAI